MKTLNLSSKYHNLLFTYFFQLLFVAVVVVVAFCFFCFFCFFFVFFYSIVVVNIALLHCSCKYYKTLYCIIVFINEEEKILN